MIEKNRIRNKSFIHFQFLSHDSWKLSSKFYLRTKYSTYIGDIYLFCFTLLFQQCMYIVIFLIDYIYVSLINCPIVFFQLLQNMHAYVTIKRNLKGMKRVIEHTK